MPVNSLKKRKITVPELHIECAASYKNRKNPKLTFALSEIYIKQLEQVAKETNVSVFPLEERE